MIVVLNGTPRSGKTSIARALGFVNFGVDSTMGTRPEPLLPGIGLRPGGERPDLEESVVRLCGALWDGVRVHASRDLGVAVDVGLHDDYSQPLEVRARARLPVLGVGIRYPREVVIERRLATGTMPDDVTLIDRWDAAVHEGMTYNIEIDTSRWTPEEAAARILALRNVS